MSHSTPQCTNYIRAPCFGRYQADCDTIQGTLDYFIERLSDDATTEIRKLKGCDVVGALRALVDQIEMGNPVDDHSHNLRMSVAFTQEKELLGCTDQ